MGYNDPAMMYTLMIFGYVFATTLDTLMDIWNTVWRSQSNRETFLYFTWVSLKALGAPPGTRFGHKGSQPPCVCPPSPLWCGVGWGVEGGGVKDCTSCIGRSTGARLRREGEGEVPRVLEGGGRGPLALGPGAYIYIYTYISVLSCGKAEPPMALPWPSFPV